MRIIKLTMTPKAIAEAAEAKSPYAPKAISENGSASFVMLMILFLTSVLLVLLKAMKILSIIVLSEQKVTSSVNDNA
jgi:hypothetical protein